jgi:hypothetical protein
MNLFKTFGNWILSLFSREISAPAAATPVEDPPMPPVAKPGWKDAQREAEAELARRRAAGDP